jgi:hypothetical protein
VKLSSEIAREFIYSKMSPGAPGYEREAVTDEGSGRWMSHHALVLKDSEGRYWSAGFSQGLTEMQDSYPFEYDGDEIEFVQVEKVPVITYEYREVKPDEGGVNVPAGDSPDPQVPGEARVLSPAG